MLFWQQYYSYSNSDNLKNKKMHENAICGNANILRTSDSFLILMFW